MDIQFCPSCGRQCAGEERFCRGCGEALTDEARAGGPISEAETLVARGQLDEAIATIQRAIGDDERPEFLVAQATLYLRRGDQERAERSLERALALDATYAVAHAYKGGLLFHLGKVDEAQDCLDRAVELDPQNLLVRMKRAEFWFRLGVLSRAEDELRVGLTNGGGSPASRAQAEALFAAIEKRKRGSFDRNFVPVPLVGRLQRMFGRKPAVPEVNAEGEA